MRRAIAWLRWQHHYRIPYYKLHPRSWWPSWENRERWRRERRLQKQVDDYVTRLVTPGGKHGTHG